MDRFEELRQRLREAVHTEDAVSAESDAEVLKRRLAELAARQLETEAREIVDHVVVVRRGDVFLGIPMAAMTEVRTVEVVGLPGAGGAIDGVFHIRGAIFSLVDLGGFFGDAEPVAHGDRTPVAVIKGSPGSLGLRIDEVVGPRQVFADEIDHGSRTRGLPFVAHMTLDLVHILDPEAVTSMPEVCVSGSKT